MAHAEKCPVCEGTGNNVIAEEEPPMNTCKGCGGKGWVEVEDSPHTTTTGNDLGTPNLGTAVGSSG